MNTKVCKDQKKFQRKHGKRNTVAYMSWNCIIQRCNNTNSTNYKNYGGKGVNVYKPWADNFMNFYNYVSRLKNYSDFRKSKKFSERITIERINVNKGYEPGNVKWIKFKNQVYNRGISSKNKSGYTGITLYKRYNTWSAKICVLRKQIHIGYFKKIEDAVKARDNYILKNNLPHKLSYD